ncbi:hypothetical protein TNCV_4007481 [Trichonephila clavipes]|nr:hypothetical protein TNCV_4007481 [Trichonephila clavipes]
MPYALMRQKKTRHHKPRTVCTARPTLAPFFYMIGKATKSCITCKALKKDAGSEFTTCNKLPPGQSRLQLQTKTQLASVFWDVHGLLLIDSNRYCEVAMSGGLHRILHQHDNSSSHTSRRVIGLQCGHTHPRPI